MNPCSWRAAVFFISFSEKGVPKILVSTSKFISKVLLYRGLAINSYLKKNVYLS